MQRKTQIINISYEEYWVVILLSSYAKRCPVTCLIWQRCVSPITATFPAIIMFFWLLLVLDEDFIQSLWLCYINLLNTTKLHFFNNWKLSSNKLFLKFLDFWYRWGKILVDAKFMQSLCCIKVFFLGKILLQLVKNR